jgi:hypothetical protein
MRKEGWKKGSNERKKHAKKSNIRHKRKIRYDTNKKKKNDSEEDILV